VNPPLSILEVNILSRPLPPERVCTCFALVRCKNCRAWAKAHPAGGIPGDAAEFMDENPLDRDVDERIREARRRVKELQEARDSAVWFSEERRELSVELLRARRQLEGYQRCSRRDGERKREYAPRPNQRKTLEEIVQLIAKIESDIALAVQARDSAEPGTEAWRDGVNTVKYHRGRMHRAKNLIAYRRMKKQEKELAYA